MILTLSVLFFRLATMISKAVGDSSHCGVQVSFTLLDLASIFAFINFMPPACLPYFSSWTLCILSLYNFWSLVISMISGSTCLAAVRMILLNVGNRMLLIVDIPSRLLRLPFLLHAGYCSLIWEGTFWVLKVVFTMNTMSAASFRHSIIASIVREKRIVLSALVGFLTGPEIGLVWFFPGRWGVQPWLFVFTCWPFVIDTLMCLILLLPLPFLYLVGERLNRLQ